MITADNRRIAAPDRIAEETFLSYQKRVDDYFHSSAHYWKQIYEEDSVHAAIHQHRFDRVMAIVDRLALSKTARVLEIGCGAGLTTVAMAERGYCVDAVDTVPNMIEYTRELAARRGVQSLIKTSLGDIQNLTAADNTYDLVLAIGVLPWLRDVERPLAEMRRVLRSGGALLVNIDSKWSLNRLLDPGLNPLVQPLKRAVLHALERSGLRSSEAIAVTMSCRRFDRRLQQLGFSNVASTTLGFGPFTFLGREIPTTGLGGTLARRMQTWADRGVPGIRSLGAQYLVAMRKEN